MEKVKVTQEQAKAIEYALQEVGEYKGNPDKLLRHASMSNVNFRNELHPLDTIDIVTLAKALYIGYEVEPEFKVGDFVFYELVQNIGEVYQVLEDSLHIRYLGKETISFVPFEYVRHATPDEITKEKRRRWWAKHGREVWELKEGDVLKHEYYITYIAGVNPFEYVIVGDEHEIRVDKSDHERLEKTFKVVCFAEDRRDE